MAYTEKQFLTDVRIEAVKLRATATKEEREKLCLNILDPNHIQRCVYGLMTGNCDSDRAMELITSCCARYIVDSAFSNTAYQGFERIQQHVNGSSMPVLNGRRHDFDNNSTAHYSTIEAYIMLPTANIASLITFLRGETEELNLGF